MALSACRSRGENAMVQLAKRHERRYRGDQSVSGVAQSPPELFARAFIWLFVAVPTNRRESAAKRCWAVRRLL